MTSETEPIPLVVGIVGHRDLRPRDVAGLRNAVRGACDELRRTNPHTSMIALSALAEGADRLAARVALDMGLRLVVPLPMPQAVYEHDFSSSDSVAEFRELLAKADHVIELGAHAAEGAARDRAYARAGAYIVSRCQILLALWDGSDSGLAGGTAEVVRFKLEGTAEEFTQGLSPLDSQDTGPVYWIVTPRLSGAEPAQPWCRMEKLYPRARHSSERAEETNQRILARIEAFNADAERLSGNRDAELAKSAEHLSSATDDRVGAGAAAIRRAYATADRVAAHFQRRTQDVLVALFVWAFAVITLFETYKHLVGAFPILLVLYASVAAAAYGWYYWINRRDYQNKFLDYRALAEGLRVQFFWRLAGIADGAGAHYLRKQRGELDWIRIGIKNVHFGAEMASIESAGHAGAPLLEIVLKDWVESQQRYFSHAAQRDQRFLERFDRIARSMVIAGLALALLPGILILTHFGLFPELRTWVLESPIRYDILLVLITILPIVGALFNNYVERRAFSQHAKQYGWMSILFAAAYDRLPALIAANKVKEAQHVIRELGREALAENADWVQVHRERPLEFSVTE